jgi:hypothetical protein
VDRLNFVLNLKTDSYRMKLSSLKISRRSSGDRSRLSQTITLILCLKGFFPGPPDKELNSRGDISALGLSLPIVRDILN